LGVPGTPFLAAMGRPKKAVKNMKKSGGTGVLTCALNFFSGSRAPAWEPLLAAKLCFAPMGMEFPWSNC
jgi:hypothetical protein